MTKLKELYDKKQEFVASKPLYEKQIMDELGSADETIRKISQLKHEKKIQAAKFDLQIMELEADLADSDVPKNKTQRTTYVRNKLRELKAEINNSFTLELKTRYENGSTIPELARECGAKHLAQFYSLLKQPHNPEDEARMLSTAIAVESENWDYVDNRGAHRYAFNTERDVLKYHGLEEGFVVVRWPSKEVLNGTPSLVTEIEDRRATMALTILEGTYEGPVFDEPNPYKED